MSNSHLDETLLARYAVGLLAGDPSRDADAHLAACDTCRAILDGYTRLVADLSVPPAPPAAAERTADAVRQRVRLRQFVLQLAGDPGWRAQVRQDPQGALERHRIHPTPQLVAALLELSPADEIAGDQLDERISKLAGLL
jgi:anti-sigma factor RsiW